MITRPTLTIALMTISLAVTGCAPPQEQRPAEPTSQQQMQPEPPEILQFYASPAVIERGQDTLVCYGVQNADSVILEPDARELSPSRNRCISVKPSKTTNYRLVVKGPMGEESSELAVRVTQAVNSDVRSPITMFTSNAQQVAKGQMVTLCYAVNDADSVRIDPAVRELDSMSRCFTVAPEETTTYTLTVTDKSGREHQRQITVKVQ